MENKTGWFPMLHKIIIVPEEVDIKKGAIYVPEEFTARDEQVQVLGTVVACGPEVFSDKPNSQAPKPGDVVMFAKLAGYFFKGIDGKKYRMIQDLDICAVQGKETK